MLNIIIFIGRVGDRRIEMFRRLSKAAVKIVFTRFGRAVRIIGAGHKEAEQDAKENRGRIIPFSTSVP